MKRKRTLCLLIVLLIFGFAAAPGAFAQDGADAAREYARRTQEDALAVAPDSVRDYFEGAESDFSVRGILDVILEEFSDLKALLSLPLRIFATMTAIMLAYAVAASVAPARLGGATVAVRACSGVAVAAGVSSGVMALVEEAFEVISAGSSFLLGFVPVYTGVVVASGGASSASLYGVALVALSNVISGTIAVILRPLTGVMLCLAIVAGLFDSAYFSLVGAIKRAVIWVLGISTTLFTGLVKLQSVIAVRADSLTLRSTRFLVTSSVPIIGASISEALAAVSGSLGVIRSTVGVVGIASVGVIFLPAIVNCVLCSAALFLSSVVGEMVGAREVAATVNAIRSCVDVLTALLAFFFVAVVICTGIIMSAGGVS